MKDVIEAFDQYLFEKNLKFDAVIVGGAALIIMNVVSRKTQDVDCLDPNIPEEVLNASKEFALSHKKFALASNWLNNGPVDLKRTLPSGWRLRLVDIFRGKAIYLQCLGRSDLLKTKLFACVDRDFDFDDCIAMRPSKEEFEEAYPWVCDQDANPNWPNRVDLIFGKLKKELGYE